MNIPYKYFSLKFSFRWTDRFEKVFEKNFTRMHQRQLFCDHLFRLRTGECLNREAMTPYDDNTVKRYDEVRRIFTYRVADEHGGESSTTVSVKGRAENGITLGSLDLCLDSLTAHGYDCLQTEGGIWRVLLHVM